MSEIPASLGYQMPAEWEAHSGTWMAWPHNLENWPDQDMQQVETEFLSIIHPLAKDESVHILVNDEKMEGSVASKLNDNNVEMKN